MKITGFPYILTLLLLGTNNKSSTSNLVGALIQPNPRRHCVRWGLQANVAKCQWTKLHSIASKDGEVENKNDYLSNYPTLRSFNEALVQIGNECADTRNIKFDIISRATSAEGLLQMLEANGDAPYQPSIASYNAILKIWAKTAHVLAEGNGRGDIHDVYHALDGITIPDEFTGHLNHICSARDAADQTSTILSKLEHQYLTGESSVQPDTRTYNIAMDAWNKSRAKDKSEHIQKMFKKMNVWSSKGVQGGDYGKELVNTDASYWETIKPNTMSYSICIESFQQMQHDSDIGSMEDLVKALEFEYEQNQDPDFKPDIGIANAIIKSYMRNAKYSSGGGEKHQKSMSNVSWKTSKKVEQVYTKWKKKFKDTGDDDFKPTAATTTMLIDSYSRCGDIAATEKAETLFKSLLKEWETSDDIKVKPSSKTFTAIVTAWAKTRDPRSPEKAEEMIKLMEKMFSEDSKQGINSNLAPHGQTYTAAINAWARSLDNTKPQRALKLLKKVIDLYKESKDIRIKPTLFAYNAVIDACAKCNGTTEQQSKALQIAFAVNKAIIASKIQPNHVTYSTLLKAANTLLVPGEEKSNVVRAVFAKCKKEGYVDFTVLKTLKMAANQALFIELLDEAKDRNGNIDFDLGPKEWSRNVSKR